VDEPESRKPLLTCGAHWHNTYRHCPPLSRPTHPRRIQTSLSAENLEYRLFGSCTTSQQQCRRIAVAIGAALLELMSMLRSSRSATSVTCRTHVGVLQDRGSENLPNHNLATEVFCRSQKMPESHVFLATKTLDSGKGLGERGCLASTSGTPQILRETDTPSCTIVHAPAYQT
jgi:hypothetical protein